jgi:signal transduction histidine kinase
LTGQATSPLRPPRARQPELARWLQSRTRTICDTWIARVHAYPPAASGRVLTPPAESPLRQVYAELCASLDSGRFTALDESLGALARDGFRSGYRLSDVLYMIIALNDQAWQAGLAEFLPEQALPLLQALNGVLSSALAHVARTFNEEMQAGMTADLESAQWRLGQLDRAKSNFIGVAAHELKTPLTLIQGYSDILLSDYIDPANEHAVAVARGLASGAKRLQQIVNDMLSVSMIDNEMLALHFQLTSIGHVIDLVVNDLKSDMAGRRVEVQVAEQVGAVQPIYADPQRLYDALGHIIGNGIKYTPDGGHVRISARALSVGQPDEAVIEVVIADDGIGIAPERREHIFEKFYGTTDVMRHSSGRTKFKGGGPGLGLVVAKGVVEAHGGKIWVDSPGYDEVKRPGTSVHILLPMRSTLPDTRDRLQLALDEAAS